jgi:SPOR domain
VFVKEKITHSTFLLLTTKVFNGLILKIMRTKLFIGAVKSHLRGFRLGGLLLLLCFSACKKVVPTKTQTQTTSRYEEDLSAFRPKYAAVTKNSVAPVNKTSIKDTRRPETAKADVTQKLNIVLDSIAVRNKNIRSAPGFRVQIYVGESREEALSARNQSYQLLPDETPYLIPTAPSYRVRVGDYLDRLEAQKVLATLIKQFPTALIVSDKIEIKRFGREEEK